MNRTSTLGLLSATALAFATSACSSEGAIAELNLHDAPPQGVTSVKVKVASMQVHVADSDKAKDADPNDSSIDDDGGWESLTVDKTIDLVLLPGEDAAMKLGELQLPEGKVTQVRLVLDTSKPEFNTATYNGADCNLNVAKVAKKGIKINHVFKAFESKKNGRQQVWVDFDLAESLKAKDGCFELDPKLKLSKVKLDGGDVKVK